MPYASIYFSPDRGTADLVIGFIDRTTTTLDVAMYTLTHDGIADALIRAYERGVKVRVLRDRLQSTGTYDDDAKLTAVGIPVRIWSGSGLMHHKMAIDGDQAVALGSFNWTLSADERNAENMAILRLKYIIEACQAEFNAIWEQGNPSS